MDKIKQNAFWIATGAAVLVLLALGYLLVWQKAQALAGKAEEIKAKNAALAKPLNQTPAPSQEYLKSLKDSVKTSSEEVNAAIGHYDQQGKSFDLFFDDQEVAPDVSTFAARYTDGINSLVTAYQQKHGIKVDPEGREPARPSIDRMDAQLGEANLARAMREYWVIEQVFKGLNDHGVGGLQSILFPGRDVPPEAGAAVGRVQAEVVVALRMSVLEDFLTTLLANTRVPLVVTSLSFVKDPLALAPYSALTVSKEYKDAGEAGQETYGSLQPEPTVTATLKMDALDWRGMEPVPADIPEEAAEPAKGPGGAQGRTRRSP